MFRGFKHAQPSHSLQALSSRLKHSVLIMWKVTCKQHKDGPDRDGFKPTVHHCQEMWASCPFIKLQLFLSECNNVMACKQWLLHTSGWVSCLFLPPEGSLGKGAERPVLKVLGDRGPGGALHCIHCLQGQRRSSCCHNIYFICTSLRDNCKHIPGHMCECNCTVYVCLWQLLSHIEPGHSYGLFVMTM